MSKHQRKTAKLVFRQWQNSKDLLNIFLSSRSWSLKMFSAATIKTWVCRVHSNFRFSSIATVKNEWSSQSMEVLKYRFSLNHFVCSTKETSLNRLITTGDFCPQSVFGRSAFTAFTLQGGRQEGRPACRNWASVCHWCWCDCKAAPPTTATSTISCCNQVDTGLTFGPSQAVVESGCQNECVFL